MALLSSLPFFFLSYRVLCFLCSPSSLYFLLPVILLCLSQSGCVYYCVMCPFSPSQADCSKYCFTLSMLPHAFCVSFVVRSTLSIFSNESPRPRSCYVCYVLYWEQKMGFVYGCLRNFPPLFEAGINPYLQLSRLMSSSRTILGCGCPSKNNDCQKSLSTHINSGVIVAILAGRRWPVAICCWLLAAGCWLLAGNCWLLAAGWQLLAGNCWLLAAGWQLLAADW